MAGRKDALEGLRAIVQSKGRTRCAVISDLLGSGKSFLQQKAFGQFATEQLLNEENEIVNLIVDDLVCGPPPDSKSTARIVVVDELDRKAGYQSIGKALKAVSEWIEGDRLVVLIGDYSLEDPAHLSVFDGKGGTTTVDLEPLSESLLREAIGLRLYHWVYQSKTPEIQSNKLTLDDVSKSSKEEADEAVRIMFDPDFVHALIPPTERQAATFRQVLRLLQSMAEYLPLDANPCRFSIDVYRKWVGNSFLIRPGHEARDEFVRNLLEEIRARAKRSEAWKLMNTCDWPWLPSVPNEKQPEYEAEVLEPLAQANILVPMGIPNEGGIENRLPGPYLPSVETFLYALLGRKGN
jgi:hypothetical protein